MLLLGGPMKSPTLSGAGGFIGALGTHQELSSGKIQKNLFFNGSYYCRTKRNLQTQLPPVFPAPPKAQISYQNPMHALNNNTEQRTTTPTLLQV